jgi:HK97 gp10 family phage protein
VSLKWHGDELLKQIREGTPDGLFAGGQMLVDAASSRAPKASGDLAQSGYVANEKKSTYRRDKKHNKEVQPPKGGAVAGFAVFYAKFVELGTKKHPAKPFLRPAFDELKEQIGSEITMQIGKRFK